MYSCEFAALIGHLDELFTFFGGGSGSHTVVELLCPEFLRRRGFHSVKEDLRRRKVPRGRGLWRRVQSAVGAVRPSPRVRSFGGGGEGEEGDLQPTT